MGVPCISLRGACHAHNVGASLLDAVGLGDWAVDSDDAYVARAAAAASDVRALTELRAGMRQRMLPSRLCDAKGFVSDLEATYSRLFQRWQEGGRGSSSSRSCGSAGSGTDGREPWGAAPAGTPEGHVTAGQPPSEAAARSGSGSGDDSGGSSGDDSSSMRSSQAWLSRAPSASGGDT